MRQFLQSILTKATAGRTQQATASSTKNIAKERLKIILAHQRGSQALAGVDLNALQGDLLACIQKHLAVAQGEKVNISGKIHRFMISFLVTYVNGSFDTIFNHAHS